MSDDDFSQGSPLETITEAELITGFIDDALLEVHTALPARVDSYDRSAGTVDLTILVNRKVPDGNGGYSVEEYPALADIPVKFPRCKQFAITFPLVQGDTGLVIFCETNPGNWRATGAQGDPGDIGRHALDGAIFAPGLYDDFNAPQNADANNMVVGSETSGDSRIEIAPSGGMNLGAGATKGVARKDDHVNGGTLAVVMGTGPLAAAVASVVYVDADGATHTLTTGNLGPANVVGKISEASAKIKAVD